MKHTLFADIDLVEQTRILTSGELIAFLAKFPIDTPITGPNMNELLVGEWSDAILSDKRILLCQENKRPRIK